MAVAGPLADQLIRIYVRGLPLQAEGLEAIRTQYENFRLMVEATLVRGGCGFRLQAEGDPCRANSRGARILPAEAGSHTR
jgi:hypothetical protein